MWFDEIALSEDPGTNELKQFVRGIRELLVFIFDNPQINSALFGDDKELSALAMETMRSDVFEFAKPDLIDAIDGIPETVIQSHGLRGRPLKFKFRGVIIPENSGGQK